MHIIFEGENYTCYRVIRVDQNNNDWSNATVDTSKVRPNPWDYKSTLYSDSIIVPAAGYKIVMVTFNNLMESGGEWLETGENNYCSDDYPLLDDYNSAIWANINATLKDGTKGCAFHIAKDTWVEGFKVDIRVEADSPPPPPFTGSNIFPDGIPTGYTLHSCTPNGNWDATVGDVMDISQLNYSGGEIIPDFALVQDIANFDYTEIEGVPYLSNGNDIITAITVDYDSYCFVNSRTKYKYPEEQITVENLPVATPKGTVFHTVTLDRSFCTSETSDSVQVEDGGSITVEFRAVDGYVFKSEPYCQWGIDTILGTIVTSKNATITLENIDQDLTIVAVCEEDTTEPTEETGLVFTNIYNPTFSQLKEAADALFISFGSGETINLQQYIVSVHKLFIPVPTKSLSEPIRFGKYNTGVASKVISSTTAKVSCGKVTIPEKWHNSLDYTPYTTVKIWLPFLGFFDLSIDEIMEEEIELTYTIDILSGKALAELIARGNVVYRFVGTAKSEEPYYVQSGQNISQAYINGAYNMADFTPYLLLERPMNLTPSDTHLQGLPTYRIVTIGDCTGFIQCEQVFAVGMTATDEEKQEIESLLKQGVLVD